MEGKIALEEHYSTEMNNSLWDAKNANRLFSFILPSLSESRAVNPAS
jgi:hypothetical protein